MMLMKSITGIVGVAIALVVPSVGAQKEWVDIKVNTEQC
jgi:hypothetical protein